MITPRGFFKVCIALFCMWHMSAVLIYSLFRVDGYPILAWLDSKREYIRPYMLITSQWQRWNLFSPDPLRRVIAIDIQRMNGNAWTPVKTIDEHNVGFWQRAPELKIIRRMEEDSMDLLQKRYLQDVCRTEHIADGTTLRMMKRWFIIPKNDKTQSKDWWNSWTPEWQSIEVTRTVCSHS